ncbi:hypothetical protein GGX14DRAFT_372176, partial [Mycena pura]
DEYALTLQEANLLYWASSLMGFTYSFIKHFIPKAAETPPPPFDVCHCMRVSRFPMTKSWETTLQIPPLWAGHLLEEFIDTEAEDFVKFVHNGSALPLLEPEDPLYEISEFLCFTQHVQYYKTEGADELTK